MSTNDNEGDSVHERILKTLADGPLTTSAIATAAKTSGSRASTTLNELAKAGKVGKPAGGNLRSPWILLNGKGAAELATTPSSSPSGKRRKAARAVPKRAKVTRGGGRTAPTRAGVPAAIGAATSCVEDLEMKLQVLADQAEHAGKIGGFVLREIRADLQRLGAVVPA